MALRDGSSHETHAVQPPGLSAQSDQEAPSDLSRRARRNFAFALVNQFLLRLTNFAAGLILARVLVPEQFGVVAVGLIVLGALLTFNDLGLTAAIVRAPDDTARATARTVLTVSLAISSTACLAAFFAAPSLAEWLLKDDDIAAGRLGVTVAVVRVLCLALLIDTVAGVPGALLTRELQERRRMRADLAGLFTNLPLTIVLAVAGAGPWALVAGRIVGSSVTAVGLYLLAPFRPLPGWDRTLVRPLLAFGLPMVGATMVGFLTVNVDYVVVSSMLGAGVLAVYTQAYNMARWPEGMVSLAITRTATPSFARLQGRTELLQRTYTKVMWLLATAMAPLSGLLGLLAHDVTAVLYPPEWADIAIALEFLAVLGFFAVLTGLAGDILIAFGRTRALLVAELLWLSALVPMLILGVQEAGLRGVGLAHGLAVVAVAVPSYVWMLAREGISQRGLPRLLVRPAVGVVALVAAGSVARSPFEHPFLRLTAGGLAGAAAYAAVVLPGSPFLDEVRRLRGGSRIGVDDESPAQDPTSPADGRSVEQGGRTGGPP